MKVKPLERFVDLIQHLIQVEGKLLRLPPDLVAGQLTDVETILTVDGHDEVVTGVPYSTLNDVGVLRRLDDAVLEVTRLRGVDGCIN